MKAKKRSILFLFLTLIFGQQSILFAPRSGIEQIGAGQLSGISKDNRNHINSMINQYVRDNRSLVDTIKFAPLFKLVSALRDQELYELGRLARGCGAKTVSSKILASCFETTFNQLDDARKSALKQDFKKIENLILKPRSWSERFSRSWKLISVAAMSLLALSTFFMVNRVISSTKDSVVKGINNSPELIKKTTETLTAVSDLAIAGNNARKNLADQGQTILDNFTPDENGNTPAITNLTNDLDKKVADQLKNVTNDLDEKVAKQVEVLVENVDKKLEVHLTNVTNVATKKIDGITEKVDSQVTGFKRGLNPLIYKDSKAQPVSEKAAGFVNWVSGKKNSLTELQIREFRDIKKLLESGSFDSDNIQTMLGANVPEFNERVRDYQKDHFNRQKAKQSALALHKQNVIDAATTFIKQGKKDLNTLSEDARRVVEEINRQNDRSWTGKLCWTNNAIGLELEVSAVQKRLEAEKAEQATVALSQPLNSSIVVELTNNNSSTASDPAPSVQLKKSDNIPPAEPADASSSSPNNGGGWSATSFAKAMWGVGKAALSRNIVDPFNIEAV